MPKAKHPETMLFVHQLCNDLGYTPQFIDAMSKGYRVKLGGVYSDEFEESVAEVQAQIDNSEYSDVGIVIKSVGMPQGPFQIMGFLVPYID